jgi:hypothetical protein
MAEVVSVDLSTRTAITREGQACQGDILAASKTLVEP